VRNERAEREQHQPEAYGNPAEVLCPAVARGAEDDDPDQDEQRRHRGDVKSQDLGNQRAADVGTEHDGKRRPQIDCTPRGKRGRHQSGRGAALQHRGHREADHHGPQTSPSSRL